MSEWRSLEGWGEGADRLRGRERGLGGRLGRISRLDEEGWWRRRRGGGCGERARRIPSVFTNPDQSQNTPWTVVMEARATRRSRRGRITLFNPYATQRVELLCLLPTIVDNRRHSHSWLPIS